jgi:Tfp pilus assembly protein PilF
MNILRKKKMIYCVVAVVILLVVVLGVCVSSALTNNEPFSEAVQLGQEDLRKGNYESAIYHLKRAAKISPEESRYTVLINLGMAYFKAGELSSAANVFERAVLINHTEQALEALAVVRYKQGLYEEAMKAYTQATTEYGRTSNLLAGLAACHISQGNTKYAQDILLEALNRDPNNQVVLYNIASLKYDCNEFVDAANYFVRFFEVVDVDENKEQLERAREHFSALISKYPANLKKDANACYSQAVNYYRQNNLPAAFKEAVKASRLDPTEPTFTALLISISKKVNRPENIQRLTKRIKNGFPEYAEKLNIK